eukprot:CAMPEP_0182444478 /NCGR_PEP_ID=MMETSP1172-20130603/2919_1 /TAXON_ID=708627 /ORGANISM="Timspurckia oligopyrenoides, Strain CCMP3278" /LENGTH=289 /DNA_ID=CAMNT_0024640043 /DNA_START=50 /DNA_END=919 /DNA_ORIENTATION=+
MSNRKITWSKEEDELLIQLVGSDSESGRSSSRSWTCIASHLMGRNGKQCRERWMNQLNPTVRKEKWNLEEDSLLVQLHRKYGNSWSKIAKFMNHRSHNDIKNRWNSTIKRKVESDEDFLAAVDQRENSENEISATEALNKMSESFESSSVQSEAVNTVMNGCAAYGLIPFLGQDIDLSDYGRWKDDVIEDIHQLKAENIDIRPRKKYKAAFDSTCKTEVHELDSLHSVISEDVEERKGTKEDVSEMQEVAERIVIPDFADHFDSLLFDSMYSSNTYEFYEYQTQNTFYV